jgi:hypothetical protein
MRRIIQLDPRCVLRAFDIGRRVRQGVAVRSASDSRSLMAYPPRTGDRLPHRVELVASPEVDPLRGGYSV